MARRSAFPSDNHLVRFGAVSPGLPDISRVTAHRGFDGQNLGDPLGPGFSGSCLIKDYAKAGLWQRPSLSQEAPDARFCSMITGPGMLAQPVRHSVSVVWFCGG